MMDVNGTVHPASRTFFLLERMLGMTHRQLVKKRVHIARRNIQRKFGKKYSSDSEGDGPWQIPAGLKSSGTSSEVHLHGLDSGYSSNSMGDGPMWIPITMSLRDAIDACASSEPNCGINATTMNATFEKTNPPWSQLASWDGQRTADAIFLFISYGYQCGKCGKHFIGDDYHTEERAVACAHCAIIVTAASRLSKLASQLRARYGESGTTYAGPYAGRSDTDSEHLSQARTEPLDSGQRLPLARHEPVCHTRVASTFHLKVR
jgi:hypothetical protein